MSERDFFYDNIKGLLMISVVLCHMLGCCMTKNDLFVRTRVVFIFYFHMPLFIFISGFFSKNAEKCRETAFRNLFLVYVVAQIFWVIFKFVANGSTYYIHHFLDPGYAIWYIVSLFFWRLFLKDLIRIPHILIISFLISPLIMFLTDAELILALNKTIGFLFFFMLGYYANAEHIQKIRRISPYIAWFLLALVFIVTMLMLKNGMSYGAVKSVLMHTMSMADFPNIGIGLLSYYGASAVAVLCGVLVIAAIPKKKVFLAAVGEDTMPLYLSHTYFLILGDLFFAAVSLPHLAEYGIAVAVCVLLVIVFSSQWYRHCFHAVYDFLIGWVYPKIQQKQS